MEAAIKEELRKEFRTVHVDLEPMCELFTLFMLQGMKPNSSHPYNMMH